MIAVEEVIALDERVDRVRLSIGVRQLPDDAGVLSVEMVREADELERLHGDSES